MTGGQDPLPTPSTTRVALLGTGRMGSVIARKVAAAGFPLRLWNRTPERARAVGVGEVARTPGEAVAEAEVVLSVLYGPDAVRQVYGALTGSRGQVYVEMSTAGPAVAEELAARLAESGAELLVAPILGTPLAVEQGSALVLAGGEDGAFERAREVLAAFGQPEHVGGRGDAAGLKLVVNAMLGGCNLLAAELLSLAARAGLDREAAFRLLCRLVPGLQVRRRSYLEGVHEPPLFTLDGLVKDLTLALDLGRAAGAPLPVTALARELCAEAALDHGHQEMSAVIERYPGSGAGGGR
ncbi:MAG TPA: NAD(P)-dependent oxidoreductase [Candidatus Dormibacteraeota bacterium]|jgi:3-hydroxyisobutyrate dehydrogenase-like beta-hydroxyacid dehydrogenase|nr:NAD(P)-dependent oxidoreductase [Candidatus Dormibacteraeota bacterium]